MALVDSVIGHSKRNAAGFSSSGNAEVYAAERFMMVERLEQKKRRGAYATWGNTFYKSLPNIAPLRGALAVWGLGVDDIQVASFHGTSTNANDRNESQVRPPFIIRWVFPFCFELSFPGTSYLTRRGFCSSCCCLSVLFARTHTQVVHRQFEHLGRTRGNPVYCIAQKWLTGHPKGPAAVRKTPLFARFIYKMHLSTKTGSGQT